MNEAVSNSGPNESTRQAQQDTLLAPRFYTTDVAALGLAAA